MILEGIAITTIVFGALAILFMVGLWWVLQRGEEFQQILDN